MVSNIHISACRYCLYGARIPTYIGINNDWDLLGRVLDLRVYIGARTRT